VSEGGARRRQALIQCGVMIVISLILFFVFHKAVIGVVVLSLAAIVVSTGFLVPLAFDAIERGGKALGRWVAAGLTWLLLVPFFYIVFVPGRFFIKLRGKDPLCRAFPTDEPTYWVPRTRVTDVSYYEKQH